MTWIPSSEETLKSHDSHVLIGGKRRLYIFYEFIMCKFWSSLISEISYLQLRTLDLSGNRIVSLPVELRFMTSVVNLNLGENPLTCPLANVRILASWSPRTIPILCQHIFGLFQTHPSTIFSINTVLNENKKWHFLNPPYQSFCWRNVRGSLTWLGLVAGNFLLNLQVLWWVP